ncbi:MAG: hypothetical protein SGI88_00365 [Candidatus Hydrogenedentes bacterium]|nr:hypothetical protein [Candidatus Hydrogenedentota bacterium]
MAFRLGDYVVYGEIRNLKNYQTFGFLVMRAESVDDQHVIHLNLTGNCNPDLTGKCFRFWPEGEGKEGPIYLRSDFKGFRDMQVGTTGDMTAEGWVRTFECSVEEFLRRSRLGEPPPTTWKRRLYLEWFSQNGRVVLELGGAIVEQCTRQPLNNDDEGEWAPLPNRAMPPELDTSPKPAGPSITVMRLEEDTAKVERWAPPLQEVEGDADSLQGQLDQEARAIDRALQGDPAGDDDEECIREMELIDYCMEHAQERPIGNLLKGTRELPAPEPLDDDQIEIELKTLLGELALLGIALDVCEHFTPRDCYRLLRDKILPEGEAYEELVGTGWVQHVCTSDYCEQCQKDADAESMFTNGN